MAEEEHKRMTVEIVSGEARVWRGHADTLVAHTEAGEIGILRGHEPMLALLAPGEVRIERPADEGGGTLRAWAEDGFLSIERTITRVVALKARILADGEKPEGVQAR